MIKISERATREACEKLPVNPWSGCVLISSPTKGLIPISAGETKTNKRSIIIRTEDGVRNDLQYFDKSCQTQGQLVEPLRVFVRSCFLKDHHLVRKISKPSGFSWISNALKFNCET